MSLIPINFVWALEVQIITKLDTGNNYFSANEFFHFVQINQKILTKETRDIPLKLLFFIHNEMFKILRIILMLFIGIWDFLNVIS